jgi:hypothetical protein
MQQPKKPIQIKSNCTEHTIEINNLKKDMETRIRHEQKLMETLKNLENLADKLNENYFEVNLSLVHLKDLPKRVRVLEDKSITQSMLEKGIWFIVGIAISVIIQRQWEAITTTKPEPKYKIETEQ